MIVIQDDKIKKRAFVCGLFVYGLILTGRSQEADATVPKVAQSTNSVTKPVGASTAEWTGPDTSDGFDWIELTDWMDANAGYNFGIMNKRSGTYTHHATAGLSIELTSKLDLDLSAV